MQRSLKKWLWLLAFLSIAAGFLVHPDHAVFWWHHVPSLDAIVGGAGTLLLMGVIRIVASFAAKKEDFYD
jgi:hypothetical protein